MEIVIKILILLVFFWFGISSFIVANAKKYEDNKPHKKNRDRG